MSRAPDDIAPSFRFIEHPTEKSPFGAIPRFPGVRGKFFRTEEERLQYARANLPRRIAKEEYLELKAIIGDVKMTVVLDYFERTGRGLRLLVDQAVDEFIAALVS